MINPCYGCESRHSECHSSCELYVNWVDEHKKKVEKLNKKKSFEHSYNSYKKEVIRKTKNKRRRTVKGSWVNN